MQLKLNMLGGALVAATLTCAASASIDLNLGGGWQATIFDPDNVDLVVDHVGSDFIVLQKFVTFDRLDPFTGLPQPQSIAFTQIAPDAQTVPRIIITEEFVFNNTPVGWTGFRFALLGAVAEFNPTESAGFSIDPFTSLTFHNNNKEALASGGFIPSGGSWNPGFVSGALVIDVDLSPVEPVTFVFKELPIPAPGAIALLGVAGLIARRRRRE